MRRRSMPRKATLVRPGVADGGEPPSLTAPWGNVSPSQVTSPGLKREWGPSPRHPMKATDIKKGETYTATASDGRVTTVRVDEVIKRNGKTAWRITDLQTSKRFIVEDPARFKSKVEDKLPRGFPEGEGAFPQAAYDESKRLEGEKRSPKSSASGATLLKSGSIRSTPAPANAGSATTDSGITTKPFTTSSPAKVDKVIKSANAVINKLLAKQQAIDAADNFPHLIVKARAGTGKTTTIEHAVRKLRRKESNLVPTDQQQVIWDHILMSKNVRSIGVVAFNNSVAKELKKRMMTGTPNALADAMTAHGLGMKAIRQRFRLKPGDEAVHEFLVDDLIGELLGKDAKALKKQMPVMFSAVRKLVDLCKLNLLDGHNQNEVFDLARHYDIDLETEDGEDVSEAVLELVPLVMEESKNVAKRGCISFVDMVWLPVVLNLPLRKYDILFVDESQDLSLCIQELVKRAGRRLVFVGDDKQAIYAFAGADAKALTRLKDELAASPRGIVELPLTKTRRCGRAIVEEAKRLVPDFEGFPENNPGEVMRVRYRPTPHGQPNWRGMAKPGDMVLCRTNGPLVSECFALIKQGKPANIQGRDIGKNLIDQVNSLSGKDNFMLTTDFVTALEEWYTRAVAAEQARRNPSESKLISMSDRFQCLMTFAEQADTTGGIIDKIVGVFSGDGKDNNVILLASVHKAKGLEANTVFLLEPEGSTIPHPNAKTAMAIEQEMNLRYVAITRAIRTLVYVA